MGLQHLTEQCAWSSYDEAFSRALATAAGLGVSHVIFGDILFEEHRAWATRLAESQGLTAVEPLWGHSTTDLYRDFLALGGRARIVTIRSSELDESFLGRELSADMLDEFVALGVDPCGERGEYHTVVTDCPGLLSSARAARLRPRRPERLRRRGSRHPMSLLADGVSFAYDPPQPVLTDVRAVIERGGLVGILGPNGSGKTTLLRLLAGLLAPQRGKVTLDGMDLRTLGRAAAARRMAVVPQETQLAFEYTVLEMAVMGRYPHLRGSFEVEGPDDLAIARDALGATGTLHLESRYFNTLSGGEKQRVVIAGALSQFSPRDQSHTNSTEVLLLDEPTASLDLAYQLEIRSILLQLNQQRNLTIVVSTHDLNLAAGLCRDLILLDRGRVLAAGPAERMLQPALIQQLYGVDVDISVHAKTGHLTVVPLARIGQLSP